MTIEDEIAQLERQIVAAKGQAHLQAVYDREKHSSNHQSLGGFLRALAILNREIGALEGEQRVRASTAGAPSATPSPILPLGHQHQCLLPPASGVPADIRQTFQALPASGVPADVRQAFLALGPAQRATFFLANRHALICAAANGPVCGSAGAREHATFRAMVNELDAVTADAEPDRNAPDEAILAHYEVLLSRGSAQVVSAASFWEEHRQAISRAMTKRQRQTKSSR